MIGICRSTISLLLIAVMCSTTVFAQADKAILYPGPGIVLNGAPIRISTAVSSGDTVQTSTSSAQLAGKGVMVQVDPSSTLKFGDVMILECGGVVVSSGSNGVQASDTRVTPQNGTAKFQMTNRAGKLTINVQSGTVRVSNDQVTNLGAGQSAEFPSADTCPVLASGKPVAPGSVGKGNWVLIGAAAAGGGTAIYYVTRSPASPSSPR